MNPRLPSLALALSVVSPLVAQTSSLTVTEVTQLHEAMPAASARFGRDVLLSGETALVLQGTLTSSYLPKCLVHSAAGWNQFSAPNFGALGYTMSFEGNLYLQGFPSATNSRVAVWRRNGTIWTQSWLPAPDIGPGGESFGVSTDIDGSTVVIGNSDHTENLQQEGAVYVYEDTGSALVLRQRIFGGVAGARLGTEVRVSGDDLLVYYSAAPTSFGVRAYTRQGGAWKLTQADAVLPSQLSGGIELDRGLAVARRQGGGFHVLANATGEWFVDATLPPPPGSTGAYDLEISRGVIVASDPNSDLAGIDAGAVHLYARNGGWSLQSTATASDARAGDLFGYGVALVDDRLMVGAPFDDDLADNAGAVYEFALQHPLARVHCVPEPSSIGCVAHIAFSGTPSTSAATAFLLSAQAVNSGSVGMLVYGTSGPTQARFPGGVRCVAAPRRSTARQLTGGAPGGGDCSGSLALDFNAHLASGVDPLLQVGQVVSAQWIFRDPAAASSVVASDAVLFSIGP